VTRYSHRSVVSRPLHDIAPQETPIARSPWQSARFSSCRRVYAVLAGFCVRQDFKVRKRSRAWIVTRRNLPSFLQRITNFHCFFPPKVFATISLPIFSWLFLSSALRSPHNPDKLLFSALGFIHNHVSSVIVRCSP
jgi:hypothetical protein